MTLLLNAPDQILELLRICDIDPAEIQSVEIRCTLLEKPVVTVMYKPDYSKIEFSFKLSKGVEE